MFIKFKKYLLAGVLVFALSSILCASNSYAVFENLTNTGLTIFDGMRDIIWQAAGLGIIAVAVGGIFGGFNWKWLSAIIIGLVVIALTGGILSYIVGDNGNISPIGIADTLIVNK